MLKLIVGTILGILAKEFINIPLLNITIFVLGGIVLQVVYTHRLNNHIGGVDPVQEYGVRNLKELSRIIQIPIYIKLLDIMAKSCFYAFLVSILFFFGVIGI